jgi:hypothetical protein
VDLGIVLVKDHAAVGVRDLRQVARSMGELITMAPFASSLLLPATT